MIKGSKTLLGFLLLCAVPNLSFGQNLQVHYDLRHTVDPGNQEGNFPSISFKTFKLQSYGSFLLKTEIDLDGKRKNVSKVYTQISQAVRFWEPPVFLHLEYTGGLGLFEGGNGGFYLDNSFSIGGSFPFQWQGSWGSIFLAYRLTTFRKPSHDPQLSLYWGKTYDAGLDFAMTTVCWTQNKNHGDAWTAGQRYKRWSMLTEVEVWVPIAGPLAIGTETNVSYNVYVPDNKLHIYPTIGIRYEL